MARCSVDGCERVVSSKGMCWGHYLRNRRHGTPLGGTTDRGAVRAFFEKIPDCGEGCLFWPYARDNNGYAKCDLGDGGSCYVSRRICERVHGKRGRDFDAAHSCGNGHLGCVAPWHLSWKTRKANNADKLRHGTYGLKLSQSQVREIRQLFPAKSKQELAEQFGVTRQAIHWIVAKKGWVNVKPT